MHITHNHKTGLYSLHLTLGELVSASNPSSTGKRKRRGKKAKRGHKVSRKQTKKAE